MLNFLKSDPRKKVLKEGRDLGRMADKVVNYRKDLLKDETLSAIRKRRDALGELVRSKAPTEEIRAAKEELDGTLKKHGGSFYPQKFIPENTEVLLVAALLAIGIRSFFLQPFKIPTNSMYPTYHGMTPHVYEEGEGSPGFVGQLWRRALYWAEHYEIAAPASGEVRLPVNRATLANGGGPLVPYEQVMKPWLLGSKPARRYTLYVGSEPVSFTVPIDFDMDPVFLEAFFPDAASWAEVLAPLRNRNLGSDAIIPLGLAERAERGEAFLRFDIITGDMLFVDRFSYHFVEPDIGDPIVFRTRAIPGLRNQEGVPDDSYYIKRLVGEPGDSLELDPPVLYRNGQPIEGAAAFDKNHKRAGEYNGYVYMGWLSEGQTEQIPDNHFFVMGDNSDNSFDSRGWGFPQSGESVFAKQRKLEAKRSGKPVNYVPEKAVVGKAFFIFYPISKRVGFAK